MPPAIHACVPSSYTLTKSYFFYPSVILRVDLVPLPCHQASRCLVIAVIIFPVLFLPSPPVHPILSPCPGPGLLHHQAALQPHGCLSTCHALWSLLTPQPLCLQFRVLLCTAAVQSGKGNMQQSVPQLNGTAVCIWHCRKNPSSE